jgi:hypothetical protein
VIARNARYEVLAAEALGGELFLEDASDGRVREGNQEGALGAQAIDALAHDAQAIFYINNYIPRHGAMKGMLECGCVCHSTQYFLSGTAIAHSERITIERYATQELD